MAERVIEMRRARCASMLEDGFEYKHFCELAVGHQGCHSDGAVDWSETPNAVLGRLIDLDQRRREHETARARRAVAVAFLGLLLLAVAALTAGALMTEHPMTLAPPRAVRR